MEDLGKIQVALVSLLPQVSLGSGASFFLLRECLREKIYRSAVAGMAAMPIFVVALAKVGWLQRAPQRPQIVGRGCGPANIPQTARPRILLR
jgi:hypothetical protein